jgi:hypothetical protein
MAKIKMPENTAVVSPENQKQLEMLTSYMGTLANQTEALKKRLKEIEKEHAKDQKKIDVLGLKIEKLSKKVSNLKATTDDKEISETHVTEEGDLETVPPAKETVNEAVEEEFDEFADILFAAMEEDESSKQKEGKVAWLKRKIVESTSGINPNKKLKEVLPKISSGLLKKGIVLTSLLLVAPKTTEGLFEPLSNDEEYKEWQFEQTSNKPEVKEQIIPDFDLYNSLSKNGKEIYRYEAFGPKSKDSRPYIIADKYTATIYVIGGDNMLIHSFPALFGAATGETPHTSNLSTKNPGPGATTPQGMYELLNNPDVISDHDLEKYQGNIYMVKNTENENGVYMAMHQTAYMNAENYRQRLAALASPSTEDNKMSWTCINIGKENFEEYLDKYFDVSEEGYMLYILPDNPDEQFRFENPYETKVYDKNII